MGSGADPVVGTFVAYVNDLCPECAYGAIDLGKNGDGRWDVTWWVREGRGGERGERGAHVG